MIAFPEQIDEYQKSSFCDRCGQIECIDDGRVYMVIAVNKDLSLCIDCILEDFIDDMTT